MAQNILRRDRIDTGKEEDKRKLTTFVDGRISEQVEEVASLSAPVVYGYAGVQLIPVYQKARNNTRITTGISTTKYTGDDSGGINRALFGTWFRDSQAGTQKLLVRQYIACAGAIRNPLSIFVNEESLRLDGWAGAGNTENKWVNCAHHWDAAAVKLAQVYVSEDRAGTDTAEGLVLVTGLYEGRSNYDDRLPEVFAILMGRWPAKRIASNGTIQTYTDTQAQRFGLQAALLDWLSSDHYGPGLSASDFDTTSWRKTSRGGIILTENAGSNLNIRIRKPAYDADKSNPKKEFTTIGSPLPLLARWPIWGTLDTSKTLNEVLQAFNRSCPPLLLWFDLSGKLKADVTDIVGISSPTANAVINEDDVIGQLSIAVPNTSYAHENIKVRFRDYEEDFRDSVYDINTVLANAEYATPGTYTWIVPAGVSKINVTVLGGSGGQGGSAKRTSSYSNNGGDGGSGHTAGTDGGDGGRAETRIPNRISRQPTGGVNRAGTGIAGNTVPNAFDTVCTYTATSIPPNYRCVGVFGVMVDIDSPSLTSAQIKARRGIGGGGGGLYRFVSIRTDVVAHNTYAHGGGGGGGGGSSAILRGSTVLSEAEGGRGAGGAAPFTNSTSSRPALLGENGLDKTIELSVTPGEVLTVKVGEGGSGGDGFEDGADGSDGRVNITSIQEESSSSGASHASVVTAELCGSKQHARKISQETALRSQLHRVSAQLTREFLGVEPGDILKFKTAPTGLSVLVTDRGIRPDLTVDMVGLRLPTTASEGVQPLSGNISGPSNLVAGARADYTSEFTGGTGNVTYQWQRRSGTSGAWSNVGTNHTYSTTRSSAGTYQVRCTISRGSESVTTRVLTTIWAAAIPNVSAPQVSINAVAAGNEGTTVRLVATVTGGTYDTLEYAWTVGGGSVDNASAESPTWTRPNVNANTNYNINLTVTAKGTGTKAKNGTSEQRNANQIAATVRNVLPDASAGTASVSINAIAAGNEGASVQLGATISKGTGVYDSVGYAWTADDGTLTGANTATPTWTRPQVASNKNVTLRLVLTLNGTGSTAKNGTSVALSQVTRAATVRNVAIVLPDASAGTASVSINTIAAGNEGVAIQLGATISKGTGVYDSVGYAWTADEGTLSGATTATPTWTRPQVASNKNVSIKLVLTLKGTGSTAKNGTSVALSQVTRSATVRNVVAPDTTAPVLQSVVTNTAGTTITLTYNETLDTGSVPAVDDFDLDTS